MRIISRLLSSIVLASLTASATAADLLTVYQRALQNDPVIREADANRLATREARPQAFGALLPQLEANGTATKSEGAGTQPNFERTGEVFTIDTESERDSTSYSIDLRQPIFRWGQWVNLKRANLEVARAEVTFKAAEQDLILRVAQRYFNVLSARDALDAAQASLEAFGRQLEQADKRFEVGLIAITDVQEARAFRDQATAEVIAAKRALATNEELLRELTGELFRQLAAPTDDMPLQTPDPATEERWVAAAMEQNLNLISSRFAAEIAGQDVRAVRAEHLPSLDLVARHTDNEDDITQDIRIIENGAAVHREYSTAQEGDSISLQLNVPIFSGGTTSSRVRQRVYLHRAARERLERVTRETERAARDAYLGVLSEISRVQALKQAMESSRTALQATEAGFEVGTRTTVDVLDARRQFFAAQTNYARSRYDYILNVLALQTAAGTLGAKDLEQINGWLKE